MGAFLNPERVGVRQKETSVEEGITVNQRFDSCNEEDKK
jgi:hypothetical protein